jgi:hypothetical protein
MTVSWFELERYALGELSAEEKKAVELALATDPKARARLAEIRGATTNEQAPVKREPWSIRLLAAVVTLSLAALVSRALLSGGVARDELSGAKGAALTLSVVRLHEGGVASDPQKLVLGDKYSLQVTCVPPRETTLNVSVRQDGNITEPLGGDQAVRCANDVPVTALVFDSVSPAEVCVFDRAMARKSCVLLR